MNLHLLIIEDDQAIIDNWKERLDFYGVDDAPKYIIKPTYVKELVEAKRLLESNVFDAAVIDIRLESANPRPNKDGNELFEIITNTSLAVSAVCTGEPGIVELNEHQKVVAKVFQKGDGVVQQVLDWLDEKSSMISAIQNMQKSMVSEMAKVFSKSIWPRWNYWHDVDAGLEFTKKALIRHMATHLHASFMNNEDSGSHPEEYFFIPPLREKLDTGDIIFHDGKFEVIVTPRCDMLRSKSKFPTFQLITLLDKSADWNVLENNLIAAKANASDSKIKTARSALVKFTNHNSENGSHFIQGFRMKLEGTDKLSGPFYAQFNQLRSIERTEGNVEFLTVNRVASLSNEFVPSLVERLGTYFSRIGTPDYSHPE